METFDKFAIWWSNNHSSFDWKPSVKHVGIILDNKKLCKDHIDFIFNKAKAASFSSRYYLLTHVSLDSKLRIYKVYIHPIMTYTCPIFANGSLGPILLIV